MKTNDFINSPFFAFTTFFATISTRQIQQSSYPIVSNFTDNSKEILHQRKNKGELMKSFVFEMSKWLHRVNICQQHICIRGNKEHNIQFMLWQRILLGLWNWSSILSTSKKDHIFKKGCQIMKETINIIIYEMSKISSWKGYAICKLHKK